MVPLDIKLLKLNLNYFTGGTRLKKIRNESLLTHNFHFLLLTTIQLILFSKRVRWVTLVACVRWTLEKEKILFCSGNIVIVFRELTIAPSRIRFFFVFFCFQFFLALLSERDVSFSCMAFGSNEKLSYRMCYRWRPSVFNWTSYDLSLLLTQRDWNMHNMFEWRYSIVDDVKQAVAAIKCLSEIR